MTLVPDRFSSRKLDPSFVILRSGDEWEDLSGLGGPVETDDVKGPT